MKAFVIVLSTSFLMFSNAYAKKTTAKGKTRSPASVTVKYVAEEADPSRFIDLEMEPVVDGKTSYDISISAVNNYGSNNMCDISGKFAFEVAGDKPTFTYDVADPKGGVEGPCIVKVEFDSDKYKSGPNKGQYKYLKASISQSGADYQCGCGSGAGVDGRVKVKH